MSIRQSLLAILDLGPCYGYQLRHEFHRRTGSSRPLNVGQIYNTLERLERDGLVVRDAPDAQGHIYWRITDAGSAEAAQWLSSPVVRTGSVRDELVIKLALAVTLPGADAAALVRAQRAHVLARRDQLASTPNPEIDDPDDLAADLIAHSALFDADAELRWLDYAYERLSRHPEQTSGEPLAAERPPRGRPPRSEALTAP